MLDNQSVLSKKLRIKNSMLMSKALQSKLSLEYLNDFFKMILKKKIKL